jgi:hypothetical protein
MTEHVYIDREDGLAQCSVCNGGEGSLPTACPGKSMGASLQQAVYDGDIDFVVFPNEEHGRWVQK